MTNHRKGIEPVVAAVILIAVAVALGIAVAFWATGLVGNLGQLKEMEIQNFYASYNHSTSSWDIIIKGTNTGTADISIVEITINGIPYDNYGATINTTLPYTINSGNTFSITLNLPEGNGLSHGQTIEIALTIDNGAIFKRNLNLP